MSQRIGWREAVEMMWRASVVIVLSLWPLGRPAWAGSTSITIRTVLASPAPSEGAGEASLVLEPRPAGRDVGAVVAPVIIPIAVPGETEVDLPDARSWWARIKSDTYWSKGVPIEPSPEPAGASLELFPLAHVRMSVAADSVDSLPADVEVRFAQAADDNRPSDVVVPEGTVTCDLKRPDSLCSLPAGHLDVRFMAEGFAPVYFWGLKLEAAKEYSLGDLTFVTGGSVVGWVKDEDSGPLADVDVSLMPPMQAELLDPTLGERLKRQKLHAVTNERGFFQIRGIPPSTYRVAGKKEGYARTQLDQLVVVGPRTEERLEEPLILERPTALQLSLVPPLDIHGHHWSTRLFVASKNRYLGHPREGSATDEGQWLLEGLDPGEYLLQVLDSTGAIWATRQVNLDSGEQLVSIEMPIIGVEGTVTRDGDPLSGKLWLTNGDARLEFTVDDEGEFSGLLPDEGEWRPRMMPEGLPHTTLALKPVQVRREKGKDVVVIEIEIPDTRILGQVVGPAGGPVAEAQIMVSAEGHNSSSTGSDSEGRFEIWGVPPGLAVISATKGALESDFASVPLQEGMTPPDVLLVMREEAEVSGQVMSPAGPVAGARILAWPEMSSAVGFGIENAGSDLDGVFHLNLPTSITWVNLVVQAPGFATRILKHPVKEGEPILVMLDKDAGQLFLDLRDLTASTEPGSPSVKKAPATLIFHEGVVVPVPMLRLLSQDLRPSELGSEIHLPDMESGSYRLCSAPASGNMQWAEIVASSSCSDGFLAPGGDLRLTTGATQTTTVEDRKSLQDAGQ